MTELPHVLLDTTVDGTDAMGELGARLAAVLRAGDLVVLTGPLGAGKTTLTRGLGAALGARGQVSSPTFVLARTHPTTAGPDLVHVDAYRLSDPVELDDLDLDWDAAIVVVEWGRGMVDGISGSVLDVEITRATGADDAAADDRDPDDVPDEPRRVVVTATGPRWEGVAL
ncbi:tRNA (adenosine(37)-N6)-threonylcarbamoyltransferase complex ATPase subunit type 1 TsaE [Curtobacterium flaccumfaciens]|uniref:tRNA (adenosine(37)-N6)-threonylcarbamoyltransferase complex ATPase subunit type 1 TsaE n=1 Tax=Curtobacterium flaccumfaciens TaxID=2035 RepID=UPI003CE7DE51